MTHDELLALIDRCEDFAASVGGTSGTGTALRAVVELHKPKEENGKFCQAEEQCWGCGEWGGGGDCPCDKYPCKTIQAIEKELR